MSEIKRLARQLQGIEKELQLYLRSLEHFDLAYIEDKEYQFARKLDLIALRVTAEVFKDFLMANNKLFLPEELELGYRFLIAIELRASRGIERLEKNQEFNESFTEIIEKLKEIFNKKQER